LEFKRVVRKVKWISLEVLVQNKRGENLKKNLILL